MRISITLEGLDESTAEAVLVMLREKNAGSRPVEVDTAAPDPGEDSSAAPDPDAPTLEELRAKVREFIIRNGEEPKAVQQGQDAFREILQRVAGKTVTTLTAVAESKYGVLYRALLEELAR